MKTYLKYAAMIAATIGLGSVLTACQDDFDEKPVAGVTQEPVATLQPNISILDLKKACWKDDTNYIFGMENNEDAPFVPLGTKEDGSHYIIAGRVISSDEQSNVYKSLVIQDGTAAIAMSVNRYNLYQNYRIGQEIVVDVTGMYIGKYNGLLQIGYPSWYANGNTWNASFMSPELFTDHVELNGWPDASKVDTLVVNSFSDLPSGPEGLMKWQSQLVRFNNVEFTDGGKEPFGVYQVSGTNRALTDVNGTSLNVRTSGYSTFWNKTLPAGRGDVVAILSYYGTDGWQLILNGYDGCMNFGNPTLAPGAEDNPYTVDQAIADQNMNRVGWVTGYIVGAVKEGIGPGNTQTEVTSNDDIDWAGDYGPNYYIDNSLVIGQTADTRDLAHCIIINLPVSSSLQRLGNLADHPDNLGKQIWIRGTLATFLGQPGVTDNNGASGTWRIEGVTEGPQGGDGTAADPFSSAKALEFTQALAADVATDKDYYVQGVVTAIKDLSTQFGNATYTITSEGASAGFDIFRGYYLNGDKFTSADQLKVGDQVVVCGKLINYKGNTPQMNQGGKLISINGQGTPDPGPGPDPGPVPSDDYKGNFNSFNSGKAAASPYGTYTNATGWTATNAIILGGTDGADANPLFSFIGKTGTLAPTLNGRTDKLGKLVSPVLTGGIGKLTFSYGFAYTETKCQFRVDIKDASGKVVKTETVTLDSIQKLHAYSFSLDCNVSGSFTIEISNLGYSANASANKDRVSIWNLTWTSL